MTEAENCEREPEDETLKHDNGNKSVVDMIMQDDNELAK